MKKLQLALLAGIVGSVGLGVVLKLHRPASPPATPSAALSARPIQAARASRPLDAAETIYDQHLGKGWEDWGWGPHRIPNFGSAAVRFGGYGGIVFRHAELNAPYGGFSFRYKAPPDWPHFLSVSLKRTGESDASFPKVDIAPRHVALLDGGWREVFISWSELNPANAPIDRIVISARSSVPSDWVELDKVIITKPEGAETAEASTREESVTISCGGAVRRIDPRIYGGAHGSWDSGQTGERIGGNTTSRLNWDLGNTWNAGKDWFFENTKGDTGLYDWLDAATQHHSQTALTVPMIGWVAKDASSFSFPVEKFGKQRKTDPYKPQAGDGYKPDGTAITPGPATLTSIEAPPEVIGRWIRALRDRDRARNARSAQMYILDNEPSLWNDTHRDVHPEPLGYDQLLDLSIRYGTEIRKADPEGLIAGPAEWGWTGYFFSGKDRSAGVALQPDRRAHGGEALIPWYLRKLAEHERSSGTRILDVLDVHFYPAAEGVWGANAKTDAAGAALRLRSTRALWDPQYRDESWIQEPIRLIPRLKEWVSANYPGLAISLGEWSFGADQHISGALAVAESLGRFGQQGLDAAYYWDGPKAGTRTFWAFRAFRNFDGAGAHFEDWSLPTQGSDTLSLFASRDEAGGHLVAILVNLDPTFAMDTQINLQDCGRVLSQRVFAYGANSSALKEQAAGSIEKGATSRRSTLRETVAPYSIQVVDLNVEVVANKPKR